MEWSGSFAAGSQSQEVDESRPDKTCCDAFTDGVVESVLIPCVDHLPVQSSPGTMAVDRNFEAGVVVVLAADSSGREGSGMPHGHCRVGHGRHAGGSSTECEIGEERQRGVKMSVSRWRKKM